MDEKEVRNLIRKTLKKLQSNIELHKLACDDVGDAVVFALDDTMRMLED